MAKVLVIEDEPDFSDLIGGWLKNENYTVETVDTGEDGLDRLKFYKYDIIILDWVLPGLSGVEVCRDYRNTGGTTPILMLTSKKHVDEKSQGLDAGADDYLTKPFGIAELLARVRALLRRRQFSPNDEPQATLLFGEYTIDCVNRSVTRHGQAIHLSQIEYRLLAFFAANPGRVLTHRHLLSQVWGGQAVENPQYLRVYVGHLRQKIEDNPTQPRHILTEIGVGYRFQP